MQKLVVAKKIMDKHNEVPRGNAINTSTPMLENYTAPPATYNIPQDFLGESQYSSTPKPQNSEIPTRDKILNSKLPNEIKQLMMEHPIAQPQQQTTTISNDLVERASRLMKQNSGGYVPESAKPKQQIQETKQQSSSSSGIDYKLIQKMINEAVKNALKENGLVVESSEKSNEVFNFKVGKHVFEGKVTKIKKLS